MMTSAERVLDALGDPTRRRVLERLRHGSRSVREIADRMDVEPSCDLPASESAPASRAGRSLRAEGTRRLYTIEHARHRGACAAGSMASGMRRSQPSRQAAEREAGKERKSR